MNGCSFADRAVHLGFQKDVNDRWRGLTSVCRIFTPAPLLQREARFDSLAAFLTFDQQAWQSQILKFKQAVKRTGASILGLSKDSRLTSSAFSSVI